jgi:hypothetical protein
MDVNFRYFFLIAALKFPQDQPNCFSERHGKKCNFSLAIRVVEFSNGGYKIRKIFAKESTYPKKIIEF